MRGSWPWRVWCGLRARIFGARAAERFEEHLERALRDGDRMTFHIEALERALDPGRAPAGLRH